MKRKRRRGGLTAPDSLPILSTALTVCQPDAPSTKLLKPLLGGKPVVLEVQDSRMPKRKRVSKPLLFIAPIAVYGGSGDRLVVSLQTHGCEIADIYPSIDPMVFYRLGLGMRMSKALSHSLNDIFSSKGESHGRT